MTDHRHEGLGNSVTSSHTGGASSQKTVRELPPHGPRMPAYLSRFEQFPHGSPADLAAGGLQYRMRRREYHIIGWHTQQV